jgi:hypothetical protein
METTQAGPWDSTTEQERELTIKRLKAKNDFKKHLVAHLGGSGRRSTWPDFPVAPAGPGGLQRGHAFHGDRAL